MAGCDIGLAGQLGSWAAGQPICIVVLTCNRSPSSQ